MRHTPGSPPASCQELTDIAPKLRERVNLSPQQRYRLVGVGLSNFQPEDFATQPDLFQFGD
jgi:DNA polymerase IV